jgi:hypothetical protein
VALLIVLYVVSCKLRKVPVDVACVKGMGYTLWGFAMVTIVFEWLEFASLVYKGREGIDVIIKYVTGPLVIPYFVIQFAIGAVTPILLLGYLFWRGTTGKALVAGITVAASLVLVSVLMMRWNVVIGGQEIAKTGKGLLSYHMLILHREGLLTATAVVVAPLIVLLGVVRLFPPWRDKEAGSAATSAH